MDQGLNVVELTANNPADDDDEMDDGVNLNDCFETDVTSKSISSDSENIKVQAQQDYEPTISEERQLMIFSSNMKSVLEDAGLNSLVDIELVFIPILQSKHFYVMCFNLKKAQVNVIDNIGTKADFNAEIMQATLCSYLYMTSHLIADELKKCNPVRLALPWHTVNNSVDYGVFLMRHMETYKCTSIKEWKCGLEKECEWQKTQLNDPRLK
ncbi:hypothetical protein L1987_32433 [Smallanthus sonchifolius]|uniref:Uncharacterized protein n=1 Tax=Smallanthus sonchifolius TaxID=185202 RepID=A0ACB9HPY0_9ASTR|nr:hypothetical protein L1987_32433 [Smallanthus sonchifolius]